MESVLSEYFSDIVKINEDGTEESGKVDVEEVKKFFNTLKKVFIDYYADPVYKSANYAYQQMCDNYYNIFNALLAGPLKVGEANNNQDQQSDQKNDQNQSDKEQPQAATPQAPTADTPQKPAEQPAEQVCHGFFRQCGQFCGAGKLWPAVSGI